MKVSAYGDITITIVNEPFSIHLSNEAQQFPTDENRKVSENLSYYTDVSVIKGEVSNPNFTIGGLNLLTELRYLKTQIESHFP